VDWTKLAQDRVELRASLNTLLNLRNFTVLHSIFVIVTEGSSALFHILYLYNNIVTSMNVSVT
jgi:hypothetical protein